RLLLDKPQRILGLEVLREHEHGDLGVADANLARRHEAFVGIGRWHPDVDQRHVRLHVANTGEKRICIADLLYDFDLVLAQEGCDSLADQRGVVGDYDAHGNSAPTVVPRPSALSITSVASSASSRSRSPATPASPMSLAPHKP